MITLKDLISNFCVILIFIVFGISCKKVNSKVKLSGSGPSISRISEETSPDTKNYSEFIRLTHGANKFRIQFIEAYAKACQENSEDDPEKHARPSNKMLYDILQVFTNFSKTNRYGAIDKNLMFFNENMREKVRNVFTKIEEQVKFIDGIYSRDAQAGDGVRFLGALKTISDLNSEYSALVEDRLREIVGAKKSPITSGDEPFFAKVNWLTITHLSLMLHKNLIERMKKKPKVSWNSGEYENEINVAYKSIIAESERHGLFQCSKYLKNMTFEQKNQEKVLCRKVHRLKNLWTSLGIFLNNRQFSYAMSALSKYLTEEQYLIKQIERQLKDLGYKITVTS